jgi:hypothetical protein
MAPGTSALRNRVASRKVLREVLSVVDRLLTHLDVSASAAFLLPLSSSLGRLAALRSRMRQLHGTQWVQSSSVFSDVFLAF